MSWAEIAAFRLVTAMPDRLAAFYERLGFAIGTRMPIDAAEMHLLGLHGTGWRRSLTLGAQRIDLDSFDEPGAPYPDDANAADLVFQHFAIVTNDAASAWTRARDAGARAISRDGAVALPESSGGVTAVKLRDPEGHPLEFLQFPDDDRWHGRGLLGIDHSAISVADASASRDFYRAQGLAAGDAGVNRGPEQVALDGLDDVRVDVVPMRPDRGAAHLELLGYRHPRGRPHRALSANAIAATRILWRAGRDALVRDPDGHLHQLAR